MRGRGHDKKKEQIRKCRFWLIKCNCASPHKYIFYVLSIRTHTNFVFVSHAPQQFDG